MDFAGRLHLTGSAVSKLRIPNEGALRGVQFFAAFVVLDRFAPAGIVTLSPSIAVTIR